MCIFVAQKSGEKSPVLACSLNSKNYSGEFEKEVKAASFEFPAESFGESEWSIRNKLHDSVLQKMQVGTPLKEMPITINYGIKTGFNDAFFIDGKTREKLIAEDPKSAELIKPLLRGRDIEAWSTNNDGQFLINPHNGIKEKGIKSIDINEYPAIKKHLDQFIDKLSKRGDKGETPYNLRNCAYLEDFFKPKIVYPEITSTFSFTYDESGAMCNNKNYIITENTNVIASEAKQTILKPLLAILNSNLAKLWICYNCPVLNGGARNISTTYFENFRIPLDNTELLQQLATLADEIITAKKQASCHPERSDSEVEGSGEVVQENKVPELAEGPSAVIQNRIADLEKQVNELVYKLYGVTDLEEIEAVEKR